MGVLNMNYRSFGTVEGLLNVNSRRASGVVITDLLTGKDVDYIFGCDIPPELNAFGKRVIVTGLVTTNEAGEKIRIKAQQVELFPSEDKLPTVEDITGILEGADNE